MKVNMLFDRVLLKLDTPEERTASGLYIPDTGKDAPQAGTVIAVGPGRYTESGHFITCACEVGDRVLFSKYAGSTVELDGESYLVTRDSEVLMKLANEDDES